MPEAGLHLIALGERIRSELDLLREELAPLQIQVLSFQPDYVQQRLQDLGGALIAGMAIVAAVLVASMGLRLGLVISANPPCSGDTSTGSSIGFSSPDSGETPVADASDGDRSGGVGLELVAELARARRGLRLWREQLGSAEAS